MSGSSTLAALATPTMLAVWALLVVASLFAYVLDLQVNDRHPSVLMAFIWFATVCYSGPLGLAVYWYAGPPNHGESVFQQGARAVAHCYSGCGAGEVVGVAIAAGVLGLGNLATGVLTYALAYVIGYALTVYPMLRHGTNLDHAVRHAFVTETASITTMEVVAIGVDTLLTGSNTLTSPVFWTALVVSLTAGLLAAYPVNVYLAHAGYSHDM